MNHVAFETAAEELHDLIREADADTLAALYEYAFGSVLACYVDEDKGCLEVHSAEECCPDGRPLH